MEDTLVLTLSVTPKGEVVWWISSPFALQMNHGLVDELSATLRHFLQDFVRARG